MIPTSNRPIVADELVADEELASAIRSAVAARVPRRAMLRYAPTARTPCLGDVVLAEVDSVGDDDRIETAVIPWVGNDRPDTVPLIQTAPSFATLALQHGRRLIGVIGGRYATDYLSARVPNSPTEKLDLLTFGGVIGEIMSRNSGQGCQPTVRPLAYFTNQAGQIVNTRQFRPSLPVAQRLDPRARLIVVTGGSMESGKTTAVQAIVANLADSGREVFAGKVTGCGSFRDPHRIGAGGGRGVTEFMALGYPSTNSLVGSELQELFWDMVGLLMGSGPPITGTRYVVLEIADGLAQPETRQLLMNPAIVAGVHRIVYAAPDPVSAAGGVDILHRWGWPTPVVTGPVANSELGRLEVRWLCGENNINFLNTASKNNVDATFLM